MESFIDQPLYAKVHKAAMKVFQLSQEFPNEEKYSLTSEVRKSSREAASEAAAAWAIRDWNEKVEERLVNLIASVESTKSWMLFAYNCNYLHREAYLSLEIEYEDLVKEARQVMLYGWTNTAALKEACA